MRSNHPISQRSWSALSMGLVTLAIALGGLVTPSAWAGKTIMQDAFLGEDDNGQHYLTWESGDYDSLENLNGDIDPYTGELIQWNVESDPEASGGQTLRSGGDGGYNVNPAPGAAEAVYKLQFTTADYYAFFVRYKNQGYKGSRDSFYYSGDPWIGPGQFFTTPTAPHATQTNYLSGDPALLDDPGPPPVAEYFYDFIGYMNIGSETGDAADVDEVVEFRIGLRKGDMIVDRFVIADNTEVGAGGLPGIASQTIAGMLAGDWEQTANPLFELDAIPNSPVISDGLTGDFDGDNDVDGADFLVWQRDTNVGSLSDWQNHFGEPMGGSVAAVPEPGSLLLLLAGGGLVSLLRRRRGEWAVNVENWDAT